MGADDDGDDLVAGEGNRCESGTQLMAGDEDGHIGGGNDFVLRVIPGLLRPDVNGVAGIRAEGFGPDGAGVVGEGKVYAGDDLASGGTGVAGSGSIGVRGDGLVADGVGVSGTGTVGVRGEGIAWDEEGYPTAGGVGLDGNGEIGVRAYGSDVGGDFAGTVPLRLQPHRLATDQLRPVDTYEHHLMDPARQLPAKAQAGSMFAATTDDRNCSLWFCVATGSSDRHPARWREVLLGTMWPIGDIHERTPTPR
jgi:hypothetical protein